MSLFFMLAQSRLKGFLQIPASQSITSTQVSEGVVTARLLIDEDGGFRQFKLSSGSGATSDLSPAWWSEHPSADAGDPYHVKVTAIGVNRMIGTGMTHDTWTSIATDQIAYFSYAGEVGLNNDITTYTVAWSDDGGSTTLGSYVLTITLTNESP